MKRYEITLICLLLCLCMNAQEFEPKEYNGMLYQELASHVIDKENAALVIYLHGRHASGNDNRKQLSQAGVQAIARCPTTSITPTTFKSTGRDSQLERALQYCTSNK